MNEAQQPIVQSNAEYNETQMKKWLAYSHYWIKKNGITYCKWCGKVESISLDADACLCLENPEIKKLLKNKIKL